MNIEGLENNKNSLDRINIDKVIARILAGEAQVDDILQFNAWLNEKEENLQEFLFLKSFWESGVDTGSSCYPELAYEKRIEKVLNRPSTGRTVKYRTFISSIAASILLLLGISAALWLYRDNRPVEYYTHYNSGDVYELELSDGTHVKLNRNSKLTYSNQYGKKDRSVSLEGEAYFDVQKNSGQTFKINLDNKASIEVLGTKFNVQAYADSQKIVTTLEEGKISFHSDNKQADLTPNQQLVYHKVTGKTDIQEVEPEVFLAWKDRLYRYSSVTMKDLGEDLERIYNIQIVIPKHLENVKVSGSFIYGQNIENVLDIMQKSLDFKWKKQNNKIIIQ